MLENFFFGKKKRNDIEVRKKQVWLMKPEINDSKQEFLKLPLQVSGCDMSI